MCRARWTCAPSPPTRSGRPTSAARGCRRWCGEVLGVEMEKPHHIRVSAWDKRKLSTDQFKYACADAFASMKVGEELYTCHCDDE